MPKTDAIFENVTTVNQAADADPKILRISIDSKATVKLGNLSRGGKARTQAPQQADDHDHYWHSRLVPFGILDTRNDQLFIYFGQSAETSDFIVDCLEEWWLTYAEEYVEIEQLVINLDNGPSLNSHRTQFIKRIVAFAQASRLCIRLIYYPPYHSKYNAIERCWAALENYWSGTILKTIEDALRWAANMTWRGCTPVVDLVDKVYRKGVKPAAAELAKLEQQWQRSEQLPKWDVTVVPI